MKVRKFVILLNRDRDVTCGLKKIGRLFNGILLYSEMSICSLPNDEAGIHPGLDDYD